MESESYQNEPAVDVREWLYIDSSSAQRGPVTSSLLIKMLEKGTGVTRSTLVWKAGMDTWKTMAEAEDFQDIVKFHSAQWFFVNAEGQQRGPVISRMVLHKWHEGDIDGLTLVYSSLIGEWKKISEVAVLKEAISKLAAEEQAAEAVAKLLEDSDQNKQVYFFDEEAGMQAMPLLREGLTAPSDAASSGTSTNAAMKKSFTADSGLKYQWDDEENDWVQNDDAESDQDEGEAPGKNWKKKKEKKDEKVKEPSKLKRKAEDDEDEDGDEEDDEGDGEEVEKSDTNGEATGNGKRKRKKKQKKAKGPNNWVYVSGLPKDISMEEIKDHFSKVGLIAISAVDQQPKIKIYRDSNEDCKGDCALCYNAEVSLAMALEVLHEGYIRPGYKITVKRAEFQAREDGGAGGNGTGVGGEGEDGQNQFKQSRPKLSQAQVKVAKSAMRQALTWNEDDDMGIGKSKALRIVVIEGMFSPDNFSDEAFSQELEGDIASECGKCGEIEKITVFSKNPRGVVIVKFSTNYASQECVRLMHGRFFGGKKLRCYYWDGSTDFSATHNADHEKEEEKQETSRLEEFGDWLDKDQEELPEEFRLNVER